MQYNTNLINLQLNPAIFAKLWLIQFIKIQSLCINHMQFGDYSQQCLFQMQSKWKYWTSITIMIWMNTIRYVLVSLRGSARQDIGIEWCDIQFRGYLLLSMCLFVVVCLCWLGSSTAYQWQLAALIEDVHMAINSKCHWLGKIMHFRVVGVILQM